MQIGKIILSWLLIFSLIIPSAYSTPFAHPEDEINTEMAWVPAEIEVKLGDLELSVWFHQANVPAHSMGYLILKPDWKDLRRMFDSLNEEIDRIKEKERKICSSLLEQKDKDCIELNKELRATIDVQKSDILKLNTNITELKDELFWWKIGMGATGVLALSFGLFAISK